MIRVAALTAGRDDPAARFRVRQHVDPLRERGIEVREQVPAVGKYRPVPGWEPGSDEPVPLPLVAGWQAVKLATRLPGLVASWRADVTWLGRELLPGFRTLEPLLGRPIVFDVDDAIWLSRPGAAPRVAAIGRSAAVVAAGNRFLADWFRERGARVRVVPTAVETERFRPADGPADDHAAGKASETGEGRPIGPEAGASESWRIGWTGTRANLPRLRAVQGALAAVCQRIPEAVVRVVSDAEPGLDRLGDDRVEWVRWSPAVEAEAVRGMDVGLMPLADDEWSRGKCAFKMLQYMASGIPSVVSPVGMNAELLEAAEVGIGAEDEEEWVSALLQLYRRPERAQRMGEAGRRLAVERFSRDRVAGELAELFREVAG